MSEKDSEPNDKFGVSPAQMDVGDSDKSLEGSKHVEEVAEKEASDYYSSPEFKARERRVVRKMDFYIAPLLGLLQFISYIDRSNIGFAATQGMAVDLKLAEADLNTAISTFYVLYVLSELPMSMYAKKWKFELVLPSLTVAFGLITLGGGFVQNAGGLIGTRIILGWFEGCLFPALALFTADWYKREELAVRFAFLFGATAISGAFGGLLAYAIYHMDGAAGIAGWRWIYIIEGIITIVFGVICFFLVPSSYQKARFLNDDDKEVCRYRATVMHQYSGGSGEFTWKDIAIAAKDVKTWIHAALQFCVITPLYGFNAFLPIIVKYGLGYGTLETQYLTIPVQLWGAIIYSIIVILSDRYRKRYLFEIIFTPICALGYVILLSPVSDGVHYFACYLITTGCYIMAGNNLAWASANSAPAAKRAATLGIVLTWTDCAGVVIGQLYRSNWAPKYTVGHSWSLSVLLVACMLFTWVTYIYRSRNAQKAQKQGEVVPKEEWSDRAPDFHYQW